MLEFRHACSPAWFGRPDVSSSDWDIYAAHWRGSMQSPRDYRSVSTERLTANHWEMATTSRWSDWICHPAFSDCRLTRRYSGGAPLAPPSYSCLPLGALGCAINFAHSHNAKYTSSRPHSRCTINRKRDPSQSNFLIPRWEALRRIMTEVGNASSTIRYRCPTAERSSRCTTRRATSPRFRKKEWSILADRPCSPASVNGA